MYVSAGKFHGQGCPMKCNTVRTKLAGYFDDAVTGGARVEERVQIRQHLEGCGVCRQELERFRKLAVMLSRLPKNIPPADLAVRIKVAAAQAQRSQAWAPEQQDLELSLPHGLLIDVTVDSHGQMTDYQILSGPTNPELLHHLDQLLLFSRFSPMLSFGRPTAGGHVVLSFSAVRVRG